MNERIKELRNYLGLSQKEFSQKVQVGQSTLAMFETGDRAPKDIHIAQICNTFNVNEDWLRNGAGKMFVQPDTFSLDEYAKIHGLTERDRVIIREFMALESSAKDAVYNMLERVFLSEEWKKDKPIDYYNEVTKDQEEFEKEFKPIDPEDSKVI
ncbi:helix-turn-helix transcriptional regulator [Clostridium sp. HBUAS56010]|uniref:helix-turn-helix domain-containing protein n=1 Tax=Clostridium sp. HBUAS56010 TaxID=2571127 RepID=UPI0011780B7C|nr:helix-turn-helix transcriptional regulator [Clostridium sp. HBUAS56010]